MVLRLNFHNPNYADERHRNALTCRFDHCDNANVTINSRLLNVVADLSCQTSHRQFRVFC